MKWVRLHNAGEFDVITAINMIGASVKNVDDPIGLYGSGVKYAMAQCLREGISLKIADKGKVYTLTGKEKEFRGETFNMVCLKEKTGKAHATGMVEDFGKEDWDQNWFIFREFFSNMLDESGDWDVVDGIQPHDEGVDVFLPLNKFQYILDQLDYWFTEKDWGLKIGTGRVFKKGVFVGELPDCPFDYQDEFVQITETRTLNFRDAWSRVSTEIDRCEDVDIWEALFLSPECHGDLSLHVPSYNNGVTQAIHDALVRVYGSDYLVCPNEEQIVKDAKAMGFAPVVFSGSWGIAHCDTIRDYKNTAQDLVFRQLSSSELERVEKSLDKLADFIQPGVRESLNFRVFKAENNQLGQTDYMGNIDLADSCFSSPATLLRILLHEINHVQTKESDYSRGFPAGYEKYIVSLMI